MIWRGKIRAASGKKTRITQGSPWRWVLYPLDSEMVE